MERKCNFVEQPAKPKVEQVVGPLRECTEASKSPQVKVEKMVCHICFEKEIAVTMKLSPDQVEQV